jgi:hypothetical protein
MYITSARSGRMGATIGNNPIEGNPGLKPAGDSAHRNKAALPSPPDSAFHFGMRGHPRTLKNGDFIRCAPWNHISRILKTRPSELPVEV